MGRQSPGPIHYSYVGVLTIQVGWRWRWNRTALAILKDGHAIGRLSAVGGPFFNKGRALALLAEIELLARLFILWKGAGSQVGTKSLILKSRVIRHGVRMPIGEPGP